MKRVALFVVGAPGVGKTTLVRALLGPQLSLASALVPKPKWTVGASSFSPLLAPGWCAAGHYTGAIFDGADTIPYTGALEALAFWASDLLPRAGLTVLDGDRMSYAKGKEVVEKHADLALCAYLTAPEATIEARRAMRGSSQNATWAKGRATKAANFATSFNERSFTVVANRAAPQLAADALRCVESYL